MTVEKPQPHTARRHPEPARPAQRDVDRARDRARRRAATRSATTTTPAVVVLTGAGPRLLLRARPEGLRRSSRTSTGCTVGRIAQRSMRYYSRLILTMRRMPQPVIAAVNGPAYGGGMCLSLGGRAADRVGVGEVQRDRHRQRARRAPSSARAGCCRGSSARRTRNDMLLTGRKVDADEALRMGLVSRVVPDDELLPEALEIAAAHVRVQPLRPRDDQGHHLGEPREPEPRSRDRDRGPQPADARASPRTCPRRSGPSTRSREPVYTDEPRKDLFSAPTAE